MSNNQTITSLNRPRPGARAILCVLVLCATGIPASAQTAQDLLSKITSITGSKPKSGAKQEVDVTAHGTVEMHVADFPIADVLRLLSIKGQRNIIASPKVSGTVTANLYDVEFEEALSAILLANDAGYRIVGNFVYVYTNEELVKLALAETPSVSRVYPLNYVSATDAKTYIQPMLIDGESVTAPPDPAEGIESSANEAGGLSNAAQEFVLVHAFPNTHAKIERILKEIDVRPRQVLIEATILRAQLSEDNALGIDFAIVGGVDLELLSATSNAITDITLGALPAARLERFNANATTDFRGDVPRGGISVGIIKDHVALFLRALEQVTDTTVLANPKILALNRQKGQVIVGRRDGFLTTTVTETQAIQTVEFLETGTQLIFRPFIGDDGYIRVELHPEDSVGFVNAQGLPSEQTTEVTTNVIVKDGETILIGGLFREVTTVARNQVPGLGNVPLIGPLFRSNNDSTAREEVIILLTIHIVKDRKAYADASAAQYENVEKMRVGIRQGLMWHGRERIAQAQYRKALKALAAGDDSKANWHLKMALHNNSRFLPAIQLREKMSRSREWDEDTTGGRGFMHQLLANDRGSDGSIFGRPRVPDVASELKIEQP